MGESLFVQAGYKADDFARVTSLVREAEDNADRRASELRRWVEANTGVTLGVGLGMGPPEERVSDGYLRIAHMGHVNAHMTLGVLGALEAGMQALGIPHGKGGLAAAAAVVAGA